MLTSRKQYNNSEILRLVKTPRILLVLGLEISTITAWSFDQAVLFSELVVKADTFFRLPFVSKHFIHIFGYPNHLL